MNFKSEQARVESTGEILRAQLNSTIRLGAWLVTGSQKIEMLVRLRNKDATIPAGRVRQGRAIVLADRSAAPQ
jgi:hypothetical protein